MKILIKPSDIVKRGLWDSFKYYIVGTEKESERILLKDLEFEITERDAIIIGLLKVMETENLIHRFNDFMLNILTIKSLNHNDTFYIKKKTIDSALSTFDDKFPSYWVCEDKWKYALKELNEYINIFNNNIKELDLEKIAVKNMSFDVYHSNSVKKLLNFNNL